MKKQYDYIIILAAFAVIIFLILAGQNQPETQSQSESAPNTPEVAQLAEDPASESAKTAPEQNPDWLLPDLEVQALRDAYIITGADGKRKLRFPGTFMNTGDGQLELIGAPDKENNFVQATQRIYKKSGAPEERLVGNFVFHPTHNHWHFEDFVEFEIWSLKNEDEPDQKLLSTGKMTFCIHDYAPLPENYPGKPSSVVYPWCDSSADIQGISVGWVDTYQADIPGQELDISDLPDGTYAFLAVVDPDNRVLEKYELNNLSVSLIEITKNSVRILPAPPL